MAGKDGRKKKQKSQNSDKASKPKRRGLGAKIKGLVMGRTKKKKQNSDLNSFTLQDYDPNGASRESILERSIEVDRNSYAGQTTPQRKKDLMRDQISPISMDKAFKGASKEELTGSISLVLLLVDPNSFRFELLQLEFEAPQNASVNDVLQQIKGSVTEPALQKLTFCALADRTGKAHEKEAPLEEALTRRTHNNDILAALCEGITADECSKLARPILSDEKVVDMLEINGYDVAGWAQDKPEESTTNTNKQRQMALILCGTLLVVMFVKIVVPRMVEAKGMVVEL